MQLSGFRIFLFSSSELFAFFSQLNTKLADICNPFTGGGMNDEDWNRLISPHQPDHYLHIKSETDV